MKIKHFALTQVDVSSQRELRAAFLISADVLDHFGGVPALTEFMTELQAYANYRFERQLKGAPTMKEDQRLSPYNYISRRFNEVV